MTTKSDAIFGLLETSDNTLTAVQKNNTRQHVSTENVNVHTSVFDINGLVAHFIIIHNCGPLALTCIKVVIDIPESH